MIWYDDDIIYMNNDMLMVNFYYINWYFIIKNFFAIKYFKRMF